MSSDEVPLQITRGLLPEVSEQDSLNSHSSYTFGTLCSSLMSLLLCRTTSSFRLTLVGLFNQARRGLASSFHCCIDVVHVLGMKPGFLEHDVDVDQRRNRTTLSMLVKSMKIQSFPLCPALRFGRAVGLRPTGCVNVRTNSSEHIASHGVNCFRAFLTVMLCCLAVAL